MDSSPTKARSVNKLSGLKLQLTIFGLQIDLLNNCDNQATSFVLTNYSQFSIDLEKSVCIIYRRLPNN